METCESDSGHQGSSSSSSHESSAQQQHQQFLGDASGAIPNFAKIEPCNPLPDGISQKDLDLFEIIYKEHCEVRFCLFCIHHLRRAESSPQSKI